MVGTNPIDRPTWPDLSHLPSLRNAASGIDLETIAEEYDIDPEAVQQVDDFNEKLQILFDDNSAIEPDFLQGEVSNKGFSSNGHLYFELVGFTTTQCVVFVDRVEKVEDDIMEGSEILAGGSLNYYKDEGELSLIVEETVLLGDGAYTQWLEEVEGELEAAGIFERQYKQPIPQFPDSIGVLTSAKGDAINDLQDSLQTEKIGADLYLYDMPVQGEETVDSLVQGMSVLDQRDLDAIVITRGGGASHQFRSFNTPEIVHAIFDAETPVISALGHQADRTLTDRVADEFVITPTDTSSAFQSHVQMMEWIERNRSDLFRAYSNWMSIRLEDIRTDLKQAVRHRQRKIESWRDRVQTYRKQALAGYQRRREETVKDFKRNLSQAVSARQIAFNQYRRRISRYRKRMVSGYSNSVSNSIALLDRRLEEAQGTRITHLRSRSEWVGQQRTHLTRGYQQGVFSTTKHLKRDVDQAFKTRESINERLKQEEHKRRLKIAVASLVLLLVIFGGALLWMLLF